MLIYHLFKIQKRAFLPTLLRWKKCSDIFVGFRKDGLLAELQTKTSRSCIFSLFLSHKYQVSLIWNILIMSDLRYKKLLPSESYSSVPDWYGLFCSSLRHRYGHNYMVLMEWKIWSTRSTLHPLVWSYSIQSSSSCLWLCVRHAGQVWLYVHECAFHSTKMKIFYMSKQNVSALAHPNPNSRC